MEWEDDEHPLDDAPPSKSQRKRDMIALQKLGEELVPLPDSALAKIPMPDELREALHVARTIKAYGGRKRQLQYIGKLMREIDSGPIEAALEQRKQAARQSTQHFHQLEELRDRLLSEGNAAVEDVCARFPQAERQRLRQLQRQAIKEKEQQKSPKAARHIFQYLRELQETT